MSREIVSAPSVSCVIPMRNEKGFIGRCLDSILKNDFPQDRIEVLVIDGESTDGSAEIIASYERSGANVRLIKNPKRVVPSALNLAIKEARGEYFFVFGAHAEYASDYIRQCVELLRSTGAGNVGGPMRAVGTSWVGNAIAIATSHPFGAGDAKFRYSDKEQWVDTVFPGAWRRETLLELGGFNEDAVVNQDYELNYRLRKSGRKILLSPQVRCEYFVRDSLTRLAKQYFRYGYWKIKTLRSYPDSLRWRHLVPPVFVLALLLSAASFLFWPISLVIPAMYGSTVLLVSGKISATKGWRYLPVLPGVFSVLHIAWGLGFWIGMVRFGIPALTLKTLSRAFGSVSASE